MFLKKLFFPPILISSLLLSAQLFGQTAQIKFEHLSVADGLSQSTVNVILQDNRGFMWFGTLNGLNRYDGYEFIKYRHDPNDPHSISSDKVFSLCEDREGNLWVGTNYGLNRFDWKSESFISYQPVHDDMNSLSGYMISAIYEDKSGVLWIGTNYGLNRYNPERDNFTPYFKDPNSPAGLSDNTVVALYEDQDRYLWIGTRNGGLNRFDPERKKVTHLFRQGRQASLQYTHSVYDKIDSILNARRPLASILQIENVENAAALFEITSEARALVVSVGEGIQEMSDYGWLEKNGEPVWQMSFERTRHAGGAAKNRIQISTVTLPPGSYQLKYRSDDSHSYGHWNQLAPSDPDWWGIQFIPLFDDEAEFFEQNLKNYFRPSQLSSNAITAIKQDSEGVFWIGTSGGLNKLEFGNAEGLIATPEIGNSDSGLYQMVPRVTIYANHDLKYRKQYSPDVLREINKITRKGFLSEILNIGDFENQIRTFSLSQPVTVLVIAMGEGMKQMDDFGGIRRENRIIWQMDFDRSYHAGGAIKNRVQMELLALQPGDYRLTYRSDDLHSPQGWNDAPPTNPEFWGIRVLKVSAAQIKTLRSLLKETGTSNAITGNNINDIYDDGNGFLWIATYRGLSRFDKSTGYFLPFRHNPLLTASLSSNEVEAIYEDRSGSIWIGTILGGVNKINRNKNQFEQYTRNPFVKNTLGNKIIYAFSEDNRGLIWIGTRSGIDLFDRQKRTTVNFDFNPFRRWIRSPVLALLKDRNGYIWIGTQGLGLLKFNPAQLFDFSMSPKVRYRFDHTTPKDKLIQQFMFDPDDPNSLGQNRLWTIFEDSEGTIWVGTQGGGLNKYDPKTQGFRRYTHNASDSTALSNNYVRVIFEDAAGILWLGTHGGLNRFDKELEHFVSFRNDSKDSLSLSHDTVTSIYEQDSTVLWVATYGGGLNKFNRETGIFTRYTEKNGLPNNVVYAILPDHSGKLWLSTNNGISRFDPHSETFRNYNMDNGLQSNEFNTGAYLKCEDGNLLFGGINGFNIIDPVEVRHNKQIPAIVITNFIKFDQALKFDQAVSEMGEIRLNYDENFITFEYSALDYTNPKKNQYAYKLEGLNQDWMYCGNRRYASYTNLDPGDYTFRVIGSNNDGVWNKQGASIRITITPPFWETGWFFATVSGVLLIALLAAHKYRVAHKIKHSVQMERIRYSEREKVREQVSKDYHDELGHKLTKISLFSELIKRNLNGSSEEMRNYLDKVILASESLSINTRDFIWTLNPEKDNLYDLALYLREFGNSLFEGTDIGFQMKSLSEHLKSAKLPMEWKRHLTFIFKEGMNNILKHSQCQNVVLHFVLRNDELNIKLSDDGSGFARTQQVKRNGAGNGLPNMKARAEKISGQIQINSDIGKGTTIMFRGQIPTNGYLKKT